MILLSTASLHIGGLFAIMRQKRRNMKIEQVPLNKVIPYENNAKIHPQKQIDQIKNSMKEFGNCDPIALWENEEGLYEIVEGHGRVLALEQLGEDTIPAFFLNHLSDEQRRAYTHVHNQLTMVTGFDFDTLDEELANLDMDWESFGFERPSFEDEEEKYTRETNIPQYEPTGADVKTSQLMATGKYESLVEEIDDSSVSEDVKEFLRAAASRHIVFDYQNIAEYYANATPEEQELFERSALVILDIDDAIANGYLNLTETIEECIDA